MAHSSDGTPTLLAISAVPRDEALQATFEHATGYRLPAADINVTLTNDLPYQSLALGDDVAPVDEGYLPFGETTTSFDFTNYTVVRDYRSQPVHDPRQWTFTRDIVMTKWEVVAGEARPCQTLTLETWWELRAPINRSLSASAKIITSEQIVAQQDGPLAGIEIYTMQLGLQYRDIRTLTIPCDTNPGIYRLTFSVYKYPELELLLASKTAGFTTSDHAELARITVEK